MFSYTWLVQIHHYSLFESLEQFIFLCLAVLENTFVTSCTKGGFPVLPKYWLLPFLTDTVAGQEHGQVLFLPAAALGLGCIPLVWLQGAGWFCGTASPAWVSASLLGDSIS